MSPPELTGNAPVADAFHPASIGILPLAGIELDIAFFPGIKRLVREGAHFDKPLVGKIGLNDRITAVALADRVGYILFFLEKTLLLEIGEHLFSPCLDGKPAVLFGNRVIECSVRIEDVDNFEIMPF